MKYFITFKDLNKKQTRWTKFLFEFNFLIIFRLNKQNIKTNNFTQRIENFFVNKENERKIHNRKQLLKNEYLNKNIRKIVELTLMLLNELTKNVIWLIVLIYDLSEKKFVDKKLIEELSTENIQNENDEQEINKKLFVKKTLIENVEQKINKKLFVDKFNV